MAIFNLYFASCALLMLTLSWRTSTGVPVPPPSALSTEKCKQCSSLFKDLLQNVAQLPKNDVLCYGINSDKVVVKSTAETVLACAPTLNQKSGCMMQRNSSFSESECFQNIMKDMAHYAAAIKSYMKTTLRSTQEEVQLLTPTLEIIQSLRKNCSLMPNGNNDSSEEDAAQMWGDNAFTNRQEMCNMLRGFHVRTITINRAMGYISSGDHMK